MISYRTGIGGKGGAEVGEGHVSERVAGGLKLRATKTLNKKKIHVDFWELINLLEDTKEYRRGDNTSAYTQ